MPRRTSGRHRGRFESLESRRVLAVVAELALAFDEPTFTRSEVTSGGDTLLYIDQADRLFSTDAEVNSAPIPLGQFDYSALTSPINVDGLTYFGVDGRVGAERFLEVWSTDGTVAGTRQLANIPTRRDSFAIANDSIYVPQDTSIARVNLETLETTTIFVSSDVRFDEVFAAGDHLYAAATRITNRPTVISTELYLVDANDSAEQLATFGGLRVRPSDFQAVDNRLFFSTFNSSNDVTNVWTSDGTVAGTLAIATSNDRESLTVVEFAGSYYFTLDNSNGARFDSNALWVTDGTVEGTAQVVDLTRDADPISHYYSIDMVASESGIYFADQRGRLWKSDGTELGTEVLLETSPDNRYSLSGLQPYGSQLYFLQLDRETRHTALWQTDGTVEGTQTAWQFDRSYSQSHVIDDALVLLSSEEIWRYELGTTISGTAWFDANRNGTRETDEQRLAGIELRVVNATGQIVAMASTDAGGHYQVVLPAGESYQIEAVVPADMRLLSAGDDSVNPTTGSTRPLRIDTSRAGIDVAFEWIDETGKIRGQAWLDRALNGHPDPGELPLAGATFELIDQQATTIATTISDNHGRYEFDVTTAGSYTVRAAETDSTLLGPRGSSQLSMQNHRVTGTSHEFAAGPDLTTPIVNVGYYEKRLVPPSRYEVGGNENSNQSLLRYLRITELDTRRNQSFIELANLSDRLVLNLKDVRFLEGVGFDFSDSDLPELFPGERLVVVEDLEQFQASYDTSDILVAGEYLGRLRPDEFVNLSAPINQEIHVFQLDVENWFPRTERADFTIAIADETADPMQWGDPNLWRLSERPGGSPGRADRAPLADDVVVINEIMTNRSADNNDWIELHNTTDEPIDVSGWFLGDDTDGNPAYFRFVIPSGTIIAPQGYVTFNRIPDFGFGLSSYGETLHLTAADEQGPLGYGQSIRFSGSSLDRSFGRWVTPDGEAIMVPLKTPTFGAENSEPLESPVIMTEIMHDPAFMQDRFVELQNISSRSVRVTMNDVDLMLEPRQIALIVDIDPEDYRRKYNVDERVSIVSSRNITTASNLELFEVVTGSRTVLIDSFTSDTFAVPAAGASAERQLPEAGYGASPTSWRVTDRLGGTPGVVPGSPSLFVPGDINGDGRFDSADLVLAFQAGTYEDPEATDVTFAEGDWNGDGRFDSSDLVLAFRGLE